nr:unnamed protein product [Callosobruchus analis]
MSGKVIGSCQGRILPRFMRQVAGGPTNVRVIIALADQEYSSFLRKVQSRLWGSSTVARD